MNKSRWLPVWIALLAFEAFLPALANDWVTNWDDGIYLLENAAFRGWERAHLRWMWTAFFSGHYHPLTWMSYALDYQIWGLRPLGFHLTNLLLHSANAAIFFLVSRRSLKSGIAAFWAALFFAVHPLRVESVAWVAERRDLLSGFFLLLSVLAYLRHAEEPSRSRRFLSLSLAAYAASLLSKAMGVTLPAVLLVLDWQPLRRKAWLEKTPYFLLAGAATAAGMAAQSASRGFWTWQQHGLAQRLAQGAYGAVFYLFKTAFPFRLSPLYEMPAKLNPWQMRFLLSGAIVTLISILAWRLRRRQPLWLSAWLSYLIMLAPVCGLLAQFGPQLVADRYSYLPGLAAALLAGAAVSKCRLSAARPAAGALVFGLMILSWRQTAVWKNPETLWTRVLAVEPESALAHNNLGVMLSHQGDLQAAREHFESSLRTNGSCVEARRSAVSGQAQPEIWAQLETNPVCRQASFNLAVNQAARGELTPAIDTLSEIVATEPENRAAAANLARAKQLLRQKP
jgi:tetratricopeptide (TPR) repeat protein